MLFNILCNEHACSYFFIYSITESYINEKMLRQKWIDILNVAYEPNDNGKKNSIIERTRHWMGNTSLIGYIKGRIPASL